MLSLYKKRKKVYWGKSKCVLGPVIKISKEKAQILASTVYGMHIAWGPLIFFMRNAKVFFKLSGLCIGTSYDKTHSWLCFVLLLGFLRGPIYNYQFQMAIVRVTASTNRHTRDTTISCSRSSQIRDITIIGSSSSNKQNSPIRSNLSLTFLSRIFLYHARELENIRSGQYCITIAVLLY